MQCLYCLVLKMLMSLARSVPVGMAHVVDDFAISFLSLSRHLPPMPREMAQFDSPFFGAAFCEDINCRHLWRFVSPNGCLPDLTLECPMCHGETGGIL